MNSKNYKKSNLNILQIYKKDMIANKNYDE